MAHEAEAEVYESPDESEWLEFASCRDIAWLYRDQEQNPFFVEGRGKTYPSARIYCASCPVVVDCLIDGLDTDVGFRGGCSPVERTEIRMALEDGIRLEDAVEAIWSDHRANARGGAVPDRKVWDEWIT